MADPLSAPPVLTGHYAFFFDLDGTLAEIRPRPDQVVIPAPVLQHLSRLARQQDGAVALISGRSMRELDALVAPERFPLAGVHGAERRDINGQIDVIELPPACKARLEQWLSTAFQNLPDCMLENKGMAFALHYRQAPQCASAIQRLAEEAITQFPGMAIQPGKYVLEIKPEGVSKGEAISAFMQEPPFQGRIPVFIGDDLTDEAGFDAVRMLGGVSIKVGQGRTRAQWRLSSVESVYCWLRSMTEQQHYHALTDRRGQ